MSRSPPKSDRFFSSKLKPTPSKSKINPRFSGIFFRNPTNRKTYKEKSLSRGGYKNKNTLGIIPLLGQYSTMRNIFRVFFVSFDFSRSSLVFSSFSLNLVSTFICAIHLRRNGPMFHTSSLYLKSVPHFWSDAPGKMLGLD